jgi:O-succinylbenzoic acid--CoA ligase
MLITDTNHWSHEEFESYVEGMCEILQDLPYERIAFWGHSTPEVICLFFALWKSKKIACPLNTRLPSIQKALEDLDAYFLAPQMPSPKEPRPWMLKQDQLATLLFTSGSTGPPKIAALSVGNYITSARGSRSIIPLVSDDIWHLSLPLYHVGGIAILWRCYLAYCLISLESHPTSASYLSLVPTQLRRLQEKGCELPHLKGILLGGAPLETSYDTPWKIYPTYGMTEMTSQIAVCGRVLPYRELKLNSDGEILVKGPTLFRGYFDKKIGLSLPLDDEGWFATKDLAQWNERHELEIIGRKDNLFISGGENIQPEEIEAALKKALNLDEAIVLPIDDIVFGQRPVAFLKPFRELPAIEELLKKILPKYKIPIRVFRLPETEMLKPNRHRLKDLLKNQALIEE